jgi:long-chain acyl-CoA synthetase
MAMVDDRVLAARQEIEREIQGRTLCDLLNDNAERHGDLPAFSWKQDGAWQTASWRDYRERIAEAALGLAGLGVGKGDFVAIMASNRPEHVIADQAAFHAGAVPTTFYSTLAPEQIHYCAAHCEAKVAVLENRDVAKRWQEIREQLPALRHVVMLEDAEEFAGQPGVISWEDLVARGREALAAGRAAFDQLRAAVDPEDPATVIYTSGTTGPPKGVILTHHNVLYQTAALDRLTSVPDGLTSVSYLPLAHIAERVLSIYDPLQKVAHVYFCPEPTQAVEYVRQARPSFFFGVPRVWEKVRAGINAKLAAEPDTRKRRLAQAAVTAGLEVVRRRQRGETVPLGLRARHAVLDRLVLTKVRDAIGLDRCIFASSAASPLAVDVAEYFAALGLPLVEVYGMTETTGVATGNPPDKLKIGTVGPALPGVEVRLADDGEVLVRGPINTPGYHRRPEATAELLDADGWLHTGDVGEMDDDGYLRIVDRKKELIITSAGKNISPANVEGLLKEHALIGQALVFGDNRPYLVALVVLDHEMAPGWATREGLAFDGLASFARDPRVLEEVQRAVNAANQRLARAEQVKRFVVLQTEWTAESEELTPTLKLKRRVIHGKYAAEIADLYAT